MPERAVRPAGVLIPVTTPFDAATGDIAPVSWRGNLRRWMEHPLNGVVLFGSTGEGVLLEHRAKKVKNQKAKIKKFRFRHFLIFSISGLSHAQEVPIEIE